LFGCAKTAIRELDKAKELPLFWIKNRPFQGHSFPQMDVFWTKKDQFYQKQLLENWIRQKSCLYFRSKIEHFKAILFCKWMFCGPKNIKFIKNSY